MSNIHEEIKWKFENKSYQIADTGDYDGHGELTKGSLILLTRDEVSEEEVQPIVNALNELDINFQCQENIDTYFELAGQKIINQELSSEIESLRKEVERLKGLVETAFFDRGHSRASTDYTWQQFKQQNQL